jgi:hypothetical protein
LIVGKPKVPPPPYTAAQLTLRVRLRDALTELQAAEEAVRADRVKRLDARVPGTAFPDRCDVAAATLLEALATVSAVQRRLGVTYPIGSLEELSCEQAAHATGYWGRQVATQDAWDTAYDRARAAVDRALDGKR